MPLLLGQLVYTTFPEGEFRVLASAQVPVGIQQIFMDLVVYQHWDFYKPPSAGYRAAYLHQVTPEHSLFGWLYNDGVDDLECSHVPYFVCYYLAEPLHAVHLENIFNCLRRGPVSLIDWQNLPASLETIVAPDLWSYEPVGTGVELPFGLLEHSQTALKQGELLDLFVSVDEHEILMKLNAQTYMQQG